MKHGGSRRVRTTAMLYGSLLDTCTFALKDGSNCWLPATQAFVHPDLGRYDAATHTAGNYGTDGKRLKEHACAVWIGPGHTIKL